jgi:hypothetical protein
MQSMMTDHQLRVVRLRLIAPVWYTAFIALFLAQFAVSFALMTVISALYELVVTDFDLRHGSGYCPKTTRRSSAN